jgi:hypothetical protein
MAQTMADNRGGRHAAEGPDSIEREMDATRDRLADTIDQLVYRASPKTIARREAESLKGYFVDAQGNARVDHIVKVVGTVVGVVAALVALRKVAS